MAATISSPLTQQSRPDSFEPKVVQLYLKLFDFNAHKYTEDDEGQQTEGFWRELFLLKPDKQKFNEVLEPLSAEDLLLIQDQTRTFFRRAVSEAGSGKFPRNENALENLTGFLAAVLSKRYTNPSTDVIEVLAGLNGVDKLVSDLVNGLEAIIRQASQASFRHKATATALAMVSGSYQTSLVTYFIHKDLFPSLMKYVREDPSGSSQVLALLGLLANYNKFESQNLYQNRLEDFVNEETIHGLVQDFARTCESIRDQYVEVQDDAPVPWTLNSTLSYVGLRAFTADAKKPVPPSEDEAKVLFNNLPSMEASTILSVYSFVQANKIFASQLLSTKVENPLSEPPLSLFLSSTSYLCHHAHRGYRPLHYSILSILTLRLMAEDLILIKRLCSSDPTSRITVRLARQRAPHLPHVSSSRIPATVILDILTDTLSHNLRKRLSIPLYGLTLTVLHRLITHLDGTKTRLQHHWSYIWGSLLSLIRFLTQYASDLSQTAQSSQLKSEICTPLTSILAFSLSRGDNFLPDPASYDDLFYKLVESASHLTKFKEAYCTQDLPASDILVRATNALLAITTHYQDLLSSKAAGAGGRKTHQSPREVQQIIKEGYESLPDVAADGGAGANASAADFGQWQNWRESSWKAEIKKIVRTAVEDARVLALKN